MRNHPSPLPLVLTGVLLCFASGFAASYRFDLIASIRYAESCLESFRFSLLAGDDLSAMDAARRLESKPDVRSFEVSRDNQVWVSGGRSEILSQGGFPGRLIGARTFLVETEEQTPSGNTLRIRMAVKTGPGPWGWGLFSSILFLTGALAYWAHARSNSRRNTRMAETPERALSTDDWVVSTLSPWIRETIIILDDRWTIRFISSEAAKIFAGFAEPRLGQHLLGLEPSPSLLEALEKGIQTSVFKGFNRFPEISIRIEPLSEGGTALFLSHINEA